MTNRYMLVAGAVCLGLAACGVSSPLAPEAPRFDGGLGFGSGNRAQDSTTVTSTSEPTSDGVETERSGYTFGGGNRAQD